MAIQPSPELRLLLATDLSGDGSDARRTIARLARTCRVAVTTVHVSRPWQLGHAYGAFEAFAATGPPDARRVLVRGEDAIGAVAELCNSERFDLVMAPASARRGLPRALSSFRIRLLRRTKLPLWTGGPGVSLPAAYRPLGTIACFVDFDDNPERMLEAATALAARVGCRVRAVSVIPPLDDGSIAQVGTLHGPLDTRSAYRRMRDLVGRFAVDGVHTALGRRGPELRRLLADIGADLLLVGRRQAGIGTFGFRLPRDLDRLPCPLLYVDTAMDEPSWSRSRSYRMEPPRVSLFDPAASDVQIGLA